MFPLLKLVSEKSVLSKTKRLSSSQPLTSGGRRPAAGLTASGDESRGSAPRHPGESAGTRTRSVGPDAGVGRCAMSAEPVGMFGQRSPDVSHPDVLWPRPHAHIHTEQLRGGEPGQKKRLSGKTASIVELGLRFRAFFPQFDADFFWEYLFWIRNASQRGGEKSSIIEIHCFPPTILMELG